MLVRSPTLCSPDNAATVFSTGRDSPVRAASSTRRLADSIILASAGINCPASSRMRSPGTNWLEGISRTKPSLTTTAFGSERAFRAAKASSARRSCTTLSTAFIITIIKITKLSCPSPNNAETRAAPNKMIIK